MRLRSSLAGACSILDKRIVVHRRIVRDGDEDSLIKNIIATNYRRRGLMIATPDTARVREALREVLDRGEAVVTVVSTSPTFRASLISASTTTAPVAPPVSL